MIVVNVPIERLTNIKLIDFAGLYLSLLPKQREDTPCLDYEARGVYQHILFFLLYFCPMSGFHKFLFYSC